MLTAKRASIISGCCFLGMIYFDWFSHDRQLKGSPRGLPATSTSVEAWEPSLMWGAHRYDNRPVIVAPFLTQSNVSLAQNDRRG